MDRHSIWTTSYSPTNASHRLLQGEEWPDLIWDWTCPSFHSDCIFWEHADKDSPEMSSAPIWFSDIFQQETWYLLLCQGNPSRMWIRVWASAKADHLRANKVKSQTTVSFDTIAFSRVDFFSVPPPWNTPVPNPPNGSILIWGIRLSPLHALWGFLFKITLILAALSNPWGKWTETKTKSAPNETFCSRG